jgi:hypothetical protein
MKSNQQTPTVLSAVISKENHKNSLTEIAAYIIKEWCIKMVA